MKLNPADEQMLKYLRKQVDRLQDERYRTDARPSIKNEIFQAQQELRKFTAELREKGYSSEWLNLPTALQREMDDAQQKQKLQRWGK